MLLYEIQLPGGTQRWAPEAVAVPGVGSFEARKFQYSDVPGRQRGILDDDPFLFIILDDETWSSRLLLRTGPVGSPFIVRELDDNGMLESEGGYGGRLAGVSSMRTGNGREVHIRARSRTSPDGRARGYPLVDEFQRARRATDNTLQYTELAQTGTWSGADG